MNKIVAAGSAVVLFLAGLSVVVMGLSPANASANTSADCTPQDAFTSYFVLGQQDSLNADDATWVTADQAPGAPYVQFDERTVTDIDAVAAKHYSLRGKAKTPKYGVPPKPAEAPELWQENAPKEPHLNNPNITWIEGFGVGLHYASRRSNGLRDWFYFQPAVDAVTHQEFRYLQNHDAVTCETPNDATADVMVAGPTCDTDGTAEISGVEHAALEGVLDISVGTHSATFDAEQGHLFAAGDGVSEDGTTKTVNYTVETATGDCPKPPVNHPGPPKHNGPVEHVKPIKHDPKTFTHKAQTLPNAGLSESNNWYRPLGALLIVAGLTMGATALRRRA